MVLLCSSTAVEMDPHSRLNQFNQRGPKSGPPPVSRFMSNMLSKPSIETYPSTLSPATKPNSRSRVSPPLVSTFLVRRPIATNSRIKQNENYRKDMYLAFVNNALQQKLNVRPSSPLTSLFSLYISLGEFPAIWRARGPVQPKTPHGSNISQYIYFIEDLDTCPHPCRLPTWKNTLQPRWSHC